MANYFMAMTLYSALAVIVLSIDVADNFISEKFNIEYNREPTGQAYKYLTVRAPLECVAKCTSETDCYACSTSVHTNGSVQCAVYSSDESVIRASKTGHTTYMKEASPCPPAYTRGPSEHCYLYVQTPMSHQSAHHYCPTTHPGAYLSEIKSQNENNFIRDMIDDKSWLGFRKVSGSWTKVHSGAALTSSYTNWSNHPAPTATEPDGTGNCVFIDHVSGTWYDELCSEEHRSVCEYDG